MPRTKLIPNGNNIVHTFSDAEYICRQTCLRKHMAANNIDAVIFTLESESMYLKPFLWFLIFYGIISPIVWIPKFLFYVLKKKIDSEFSQITHLT